MRVLSYEDGAWREAEGLDALQTAAKGDADVVWADERADDLDEEEIDTLREWFDLDPLALEDARNPRQRPKLDHLEDARFLVLFQLDEEDGQLEHRQVGCFLSRNMVLTLHCGAERLLDAAVDRLAEIEDPSTEAVLHILLDTVVDDYEVAAGRLEDEVEELEAQGLRVARRGRSSARHLEALPDPSRLYSVRQQASRLRRFGLPLRGVVEALLPDIGSRDLEARFRDVLDHLVRTDAQVESVRDLAEGVLDVVRGVQADALNEVNKRLSAWAAIIAVPAVIAGLYGVNYRLLPSAAGAVFGFLFVVGLMLVTGLALFVFFKSRRWL